ncbi:hypothetical protein [Nocardiopsis lambiniae]|uniref:Uncharacterized protein n=1 Tax=Nocardiopsis lambiniae TaxID=3075539 RepID=A0ABU2MI48_9ACTN|nr:hypothetical protein [Nocardiopsis sp. DSM 44743]MDT0331916.1 hypothetical protein [Nocardiopsis sp. DSM 44743]
MPPPLAAMLVLLFAGACAPTGGEGDPPVEEVTSVGPHAEWVRQVVRTFTLERMFIEQDPDTLTADTGDGPRDVLVEAGVLVEDGEGLRVESDPADWALSDEGLSGDGPLISHVNQALADFMRVNTVTWCGPEVPGDVFVSAYPGSDGDAFETRDEYEADIADYVDCGTG